MDESRVKKLAEIYDRSMAHCAIVAEICDEVIDRSGALLGEVRAEVQRRRCEAKEAVTGDTEIGSGVSRYAENRYFSGSTKKDLAR